MDDWWWVFDGGCVGGRTRRHGLEEKLLTRARTHAHSHAHTYTHLKVKALALDGGQ